MSIVQCDVIWLLYLNVCERDSFTTFVGNDIFNSVTEWCHSYDRVSRIYGSWSHCRSVSLCVYMVHVLSEASAGTVHRTSGEGRPGRLRTPRRSGLPLARDDTRAWTGPARLQAPDWLRNSVGLGLAPDADRLRALAGSALAPDAHTALESLRRTLLPRLTEGRRPVGAGYFGPNGSRVHRHQLKSHARLYVYNVSSSIQSVFICCFEHCAIVLTSI